MTDIEVIQELCRVFGVQPSKKFSQNFLVDPRPLEVMLRVAALTKDDHVLEVGAGFGALTEKLLETGASVMAYEIDPKLAAALRLRFDGNTQLRVIEKDFFHSFQENLEKLVPHRFSIVANLPYAVSSHFFQTVLESEIQPSRIIVMLQKELAERIVAADGEKSVLSLSVQYFGVPKIECFVPRSSFWPEPNVDSAVLSVGDIHPGEGDAAELFRLAKMAFANRRKQLHNSIASGLHCSNDEARALLQSVGIDPSCRPQDLSVEAWARLAGTSSSVSSK